MGKSKPWVRPATVFGHKTISRRTFAAAIDAGVSYAGERIYDLVPRSEFERIKAEATQMDAGAWLCTGSCGCPMTNLGVVISGPRPGAGYSSPGVPSPAKRFAEGYDAYIRRHVGDSSLQLSIQD